MRTNEELLEVLADIGVDTGAELTSFLADVDRFEADLIDWILGDPTKVDVRGELSQAQAKTARATGSGWDEFTELINVADGTVEDPDR